MVRRLEVWWGLTKHRLAELLISDAFVIVNKHRLAELQKVYNMEEEDFRLFAQERRMRRSVNRFAEMMNEEVFNHHHPIFSRLASVRDLVKNEDKAKETKGQTEA